MRQTIFDTGFCRFRGIKQQLPNALKYTVENRNLILPSEEVIRLAQSIRYILKTTISEFFNRMIQAGSLNHFTVFYVPKSVSIPEILASPSITLDVRQMDVAKVLTSVPQLENKILINATGTMKVTNGEMSVSAIESLLQLFVRGHLVASYYDSDEWIDPYIAGYIMQSYSITISSLIAQYYNLSLNEMLRVAGIMSIYIAQKLSRDSDSHLNPPLMSKCSYVGSNIEIQELLRDCEDVLKMYPEGIPLEKVCNELLNTRICEKMKSFNYKVFVSLCGSLGPDIITSHIALEYPPYWLFLLLLAFSNSKIPLFSKLNANRLTQEGRTKFLYAIAVNNNLFASKR